MQEKRFNMRNRLLPVFLFISIFLTACAVTKVIPATTTPVIQSPILTATSISLALTNTPLPTKTAYASNRPKGLTFSGLVENDKFWTNQDLRDLDVVKLNLNQPYVGEHYMSGVRLNALLDIARPKKEASRLEIITADNSSVERLKNCSRLNNALSLSE